MRTLCDVCESAAAILFCAADEAALCRACDDKVEVINGMNETDHCLIYTSFENVKVKKDYFLYKNTKKVHMCNKLASRHVRVGLAKPSEVPRCDICENAPAFFYCEIDGTSLCLQCDMIVHVGGKRTHERYLLLRQRVKFPGDKSGIGSMDEPGSQRVNLGEAKRESTRFQAADVVRTANNVDSDGKMENMLIDLNARPRRVDGQAPTNQERGHALVDNNHESENVVPDGILKRKPEKH